MRLKNVRRSQNIEDRRRSSAGGKAGVGGVGLLVILAIGYFAGIDVSPFLEQAAAPQSSEPRELTTAEQRAGDFTAKVLGTTEQVWDVLLPEQAGLE